MVRFSAKCLVGCFLSTVFFGGMLLQSGCEQNAGFEGLQLNMASLPLLSDAKTRSISPENFTGEKGKGGMATEGTGKNAARELGQGWKVSPSVRIKKGQTFVMGEIEGSGVIQHIWMTPTGNWRHCIFRIYWDGEEEPSVEVPVGDFFAVGWGSFAHVNSLAVCVNPGSGLNCYWSMPFRKSCKITFENMGERDMTLYYQIDYALTDVPKDAGYLHAQFRRVNPLPDKTDYTIVDGIQGKGHYVGTYMCWGANSPGWWGEGEIKFFMDGDQKFPTICGTGTEDYFCGSYGFVSPHTKKYMEYSTAFVGMPQVIEANAEKKTPPRFSLYRWHITDPIRFDEDLRVTIQALGWQSGGRYLPLQDDLSSVAFWYQTEPHAPFPKLPSRDELSIKK
jgi:D-arabinan exo alpha-(1,3)/(1,5)-arabinofuranosidase (non-reducing end)